VRSDTLGSICPACKKPYATAGLLERVSPLAIVGLFVLVAAWLWLVITHLVAGIIVAGAAFGLLVGAIGVSNALADRGR
jgi:hypothetical protein